MRDERDWSKLRRNSNYGHTCAAPSSAATEARIPVPGNTNYERAGAASCSCTHNASMGDIILLREFQACRSSEEIFRCFRANVSQLNSRHFCEIFKLLSEDRHMRRREQPEVRELIVQAQAAVACIKQPDRGELRNLAFLANNAAKALKWSEAAAERRRLFLALVAVATRSLEILCATEIAIFAHACVTVGCKETFTRVLLEAFAESDRPRHQLPYFKSKELANFLWAYGQAGIQARNLFAEAARVVVDGKIDELSAYDVAQVAVAYARMDVKPLRLFDALAARSTRVLPGARSMQDAANLLWAYATLELPHEAPFTATCRLHSRCSEFNPQELATVFWAFSHRRQHLSAWTCTSSQAADELDVFLEALHDAVLLKLEHDEHTWTPEGLSKVACAYERLLASNLPRASRLMNAIARASSRVLRRAPRSFAAQDASWLAMAYARSELRSEDIADFFATLSGATATIISCGNFLPLNLANLAWACGFYVEHSAAPPHERWHHRMFASIASADWESMKRVLLMDVAMVATGLAKGCYAHFAFLQQISHRMTDLLAHDVSSDDVVHNVPILAWSLAIAAAEAAELVPKAFDVLTSALLRDRNVAYLDQQSLAMMLWSCAVVEYEHPTLLGLLVEQVVAQFEKERELWAFHHQDASCVTKRGDRANISVTRRQLQQYQLWVERELQRPELFLPEALRDACREDLIHNHATPTISAFQREVGRLLPSTGEAWESELVLPDGHSLDFAQRGARIGVEADGPFHYMRRADGGLVPSGATLLKRRQLAALGWRIISVPLHEWSALGHGEDARAQDDARAKYLCQLLDVVPPGTDASSDEVRAKSSIAGLREAASLS